MIFSLGFRILFLWNLLISGFAAETLQLVSPLDYQVFQRSTAAIGTMVIRGKSDRPINSTDTFEAKLIGAPMPFETWRSLSSSSQNQSEFEAKLDTPAGGWYELQVRLKRGEVTLAETHVDHIGIGEIFVIAGQSNSANHGEEKQQTKTGLVSAFNGTSWTLANDPQPGASGNGGSFIPPFGDSIARRFKVPVGIVACGVGATSVREWLPKRAQFSNPPTLTNRVIPLPSGRWQSNGELFDKLVRSMKFFAPGGFRAVLWHQGESDANQKDSTRTLSGELYTKYLDELIGDSRAAIGWQAPWFVAQATYHLPDDTGSAEIRAAQAALWKSGVALQGPDTDALTGDLRDNAGRGVHFSGKGLREHAARWTEQVAPWLDKQLAQPANAKPGPPSKLVLPGENLTIEGHPAFVFLPDEAKRQRPQPWIFYAPTLPPYPDEAERWMHEQFLAAGIAVAGIDVGEGYGSPKMHTFFDALYQELTEHRGFAKKLCLFGRSRGGLWVSSWAIANPSRVSGIIGIYPVFDFRTYPGITNAAAAYDLTPAELNSRVAEFNPVSKIRILAEAGIPISLIHGDSDKVVPLEPNSGEVQRIYNAAGKKSLCTIIILKGEGHNFYEGFFRSQPVVDFAIRRAREGSLQ
jgi:predicted esterase